MKMIGDRRGPHLGMVLGGVCFWGVVSRNVTYIFEGPPLKGQRCFELFHRRYSQLFRLK